MVFSFFCNIFRKNRILKNKESKEAESKNKSHNNKESNKEERNECLNGHIEFDDIPSYLDVIGISAIMKQEYFYFKLIIDDYAVYLIHSSDTSEGNFFQKFIKLKDSVSIAWPKKINILTKKIEKCFVLIENLSTYFIYNKNLVVNIGLGKDKNIEIADYLEIEKEENTFFFSVNDNNYCIMCCPVYKNKISKIDEDLTSDTVEDGTVLYLSYKILDENLEYSNLIKFKRDIMEFLRESAGILNSSIMSLELDYGLIGFSNTISAFFYIIKVHEALSDFINNNFIVSAAIVKGRYYLYETKNKKIHYIGRALNKAARMVKVEAYNDIKFDSETMKSLEVGNYIDILSILFEYDFYEEGEYSLRGIEEKQTIFSIKKSIQVEDD